MQKKLGENLGQTIVVKTAAGAGGTIGAAVVAKRSPTGYTVLLATIAALRIHTRISTRRCLTSLWSIRAVSMATVSGNVLVVNSSVQAKTLASMSRKRTANRAG